MGRGGSRARPVRAFLVSHADPEFRSHPSPRLTRQSCSHHSHRAGSPRTATAPTPGPPPHPSCLPPWVPGQLKESLPPGHGCFMRRAGDWYLVRRGRRLLPASVYRKCAAPPSLLLQSHWPTSEDRGHLQIPTNPVLGLLLPSMQHRL